jgi:hypothetical protein
MSRLQKELQIQIQIQHRLLSIQLKMRVQVLELIQRKSPCWILHLETQPQVKHLMKIKQKKKMQMQTKKMHGVPQTHMPHIEHSPIYSSPGKTRTSIEHLR